MRGVLYGLYDLARAAGYSFLHPLHIAQPIAMPSWCQNLSATAGSGRAGEQIQAVRGTHIHTQHPIELADLLNGVGTAAGEVGPSEDELAWVSVV